jgi:hypothetical protein
MEMSVRRTKRAQAADRADADRIYLEQVRGEPASTPTPHGAQPVPVPEQGLQTTDMQHVLTAAPSPVLGVSPILGESAASSPPPVGSFTTPPVGPPAAAYASAAFTPVPEQAMTPSATAVPPRQPSVVDQYPLDLHNTDVATLPRRQHYPSAGQHPPVSEGLDLPLLLGPGGIAPVGDLVTCPECGEMATVDAARRNAQDFCRHCDFPLFWARNTVILHSGQETGASLRRLPGTVGRAATAALMCPHCGEPNSPAAQNCIRCLLPLHPVEVVAAPIFVPPPEPERLPVPIGRDYPLWWILLVSACVLAIVLIVVWVAVN